MRTLGYLTKRNAGGHRHAGSTIPGCDQEGVKVLGRLAHLADNPYAFLEAPLRKILCALEHQPVKEI